VKEGKISLHINGKEEKFEFKPRLQEQCSMIRVRYGPNKQIKEVQIQPEIIYSISKSVKRPTQKPEQKKKAAPKKKHEEQNKACKQNKAPEEKESPLPPKKVWKEIQKATTPPKTNQMKWRPKKEQASPSTSPGQGDPSPSTGERSCSPDLKK